MKKQKLAKLACLVVLVLSFVFTGVSPAFAKGTKKTLQYTFPISNETFIPTKIGKFYKLKFTFFPEEVEADETGVLVDNLEIRWGGNLIETGQNLRQVCPSDTDCTREYDLIARDRVTKLTFESATIPQLDEYIPTITIENLKKDGKAFQVPSDMVARDIIPGFRKFTEPVERESKNGILETTLQIKYTTKEIGNDKVCLRSYENQLVGPTLRVKPGDKLIVHLQNHLPATLEEYPCEAKPDTFDKKYNITNLHTHGFAISPAGNSDNVILAIEPGYDFDNVFEIPEEHPEGTFWYHPHRHEATAMQVASGMAGALIVEGGTETSTIDTLLKEKGIDEEKIFVLAQVPFDDKGLVETFNFGPGAWETSNRFTTVNGVTWPAFYMQKNEVQRWRFIHAGVRETIKPRLCLYSHKRCKKGTEIPLYEIAADGLSFGRLDKFEKERNLITLQPGYRSDVLVQIPDPGLYVLFDEQGQKKESIRGADDLKVLAWVYVKDEEATTGNTLPSSDELALTIPKEIKDREEKIASTPKRDIVKRKFEFNITCFDGYTNINDCPNKAQELGVENPFLFTVNGDPFEVGSPEYLKVGDVEEWTFTSGLANHPFHIHVNPFKVIGRKKADNWTKQDEFKDKYNFHRESLWKDTVFVVKGYETKFLMTLDERFTGCTVFHCHILDHEDEGMMKLVKLVPPEFLDEFPFMYTCPEPTLPAVPSSAH